MTVLVVRGECVSSRGCFGKSVFLFKVVLGKSVAEVAQNVIKHVRLALLTPEELKQVEQENEKDRMIPVGTLGEKYVGN